MTASPGIHAEGGVTCAFLSSSGNGNMSVGRTEVALEWLFDLRVLSDLVTMSRTQD